MVGYGTYRGSGAAAIGIVHYINEGIFVKAGMSLGEGSSAYNVGATWKFGTSVAKRNNNSEYKGGPISSIYVMQDQITQLREENVKQQAEISELKALVYSLLNK